MPNLFTVAPSQSISSLAVTHLLAHVPRADLPRAVLLVPTRRAVITLRQELQRQLGEAPALLPRIFPLSAIDAELLTLLGERAFDVWDKILPAMPIWQQRYLLTEQVMAFEKRRRGAARLDAALTLADGLMELQDHCARAGVTLDHAKLRPLFHRDYEQHWEEALLFLSIVASTWPELEAELGLSTASHRETQILCALADAWREATPDFPVYAIGSTASQECTAALLQVIADMPNGAVILPGLPTDMADGDWQEIAPGHPLHHLKQFIARWPLPPSAVASLGTGAPNGIWLQALSAAHRMPQWKHTTLPSYDHLRLIPCAHAEEEARVITLLLREALEDPSKRTALVTPDEGLMARICAHMKRYGVTLDRVSAGKLADTQTGGLWMALLATLIAPESIGTLRQFLHHPLLAIDPEFLAQLEPHFHGVSTHRAGQLPRLPESLRADARLAPILVLVREAGRLSRARLAPSAWLAQCSAMLVNLHARNGAGAEMVEQALEPLQHADGFGLIHLHEFNALVSNALDVPWRDAAIRAHPQIALLTPLEARMQQFDRVILGNMQDSLWPGSPAPNAWLNLAAQKTLGLPTPEEQASLMAHDVLMLGSSAEVFLTYPRRDQGSPTARSRYIERLVTLLATHGIEESSITAAHYTTWASAMHAAADFSPEPPVMPYPSQAERPTQLPVSALDAMFSDPFKIYAQYVLGLRPLKDIDAEPEARDFGSLTHRAIQALTEHWNLLHRAANEQELNAITNQALRDFVDRPNIALFWRTRLYRALEFVNAEESARRTHPQQVRPEYPMTQTIPLTGDGTITLQGRIDRLEDGLIADYKTGKIPTNSELLEGRAVQLIAYAMMLEAAGEPIQALEYWRLPQHKKPGQVLRKEMAEIETAAIPDRLRAAISTLLSPETPLLARPIQNSRDERYGNDYDGISRYDEWVG